MVTLTHLVMAMDVRYDHVVVISDMSLSLLAGASFGRRVDHGSFLADGGRRRGVPSSVGTTLTGIFDPVFLPNHQRRIPIGDFVRPIAVGLTGRNRWEHRHGLLMRGRKFELDHGRFAFPRGQGVQNPVH
jgi:hypothetical protein